MIRRMTNPTNQPTAAALLAELKRLLAIREIKNAPADQGQGEGHACNSASAQRAGGDGDVHVVGDAALREALRANPRLMGK